MIFGCGTWLYLIIITDVGGDVREGKMTLPAIFLMQDAGDRARGILEGLVRDRRFDADAWMELRDLVQEHGVLERAFERATEYATKAKRFLDEFPPSPELEALRALPDYVLARDR